jgi:hypothetical protein
MFLTSISVAIGLEIVFFNLSLLRMILYFEEQLV